MIVGQSGHGVAWQGKGYIVTLATYNTCAGCGTKKRVAFPLCARCDQLEHDGLPTPRPITRCEFCHEIGPIPRHQPGCQLHHSKPHCDPDNPCSKCEHRLLRQAGILKQGAVGSWEAPQE